MYDDDGRSVGLVVDAIHDIVEAPSRARPDPVGDGFAGSLIIQQRVTHLLDIDRAILAAGASGPR